MFVSKLDSRTIETIYSDLPNTIFFHHSFNEEIKKLPDSVEKIFFYHHNMINKELSIKQMIIDDDEFIKNKDLFSKFNDYSINNLTNYVKWIIFSHDSNFNKELKTLPVDL